MPTTGNIKNMHYDFKQKLNRLDSNKYVGLQIPQIDRKLNEALSLYILLVAEPRVKNQLGIETIQRTIDDISAIVKDDVSLAVTPDGGGKFSVAVLPDDYLYYLSTAKLTATKDTCTEQKMKTIVIRHDSRSNERSFYESNFDWRECNIRFFDGGIKIFHSDFTINGFEIDYVREHPYIHNAEDFSSGSYYLPSDDATPLTGYVDCELPDITHAEIVDLAVLLTTGELELPIAYQFKQNRLSMRQLIAN